MTAECVAEALGRSWWSVGMTAVCVAEALVRSWWSVGMTAECVAEARFVACADEARVLSFASE